MTKKDGGRYRKAAAVMGELQQSFRDEEKARERKRILVTFKYNDQLMYENAETEEEARAIAIRLSKTYGRAEFTSSGGGQIRFADGEAVVQNGDANTV